MGSFLRKTGVICHGYNVKTLIEEQDAGINIVNREWRHVAWGDSEEPGRIPMAVYMAILFDAEHIHFGTGASQTNDGIWEAEFSLKYLYDHFQELTEFKIFRNVFNRLDWKNMRDVLYARSEIDITSVNTYTEIQNAMKSFKQCGIDFAIFVSNPSHIPRLAVNANKINEIEHENFFNTLFCPCVSDFARKGEKPFIAEPHSGPLEEPELMPHNVFADFFNVPSSNRSKCLKGIRKIIQKNSMHHN